MSVKWNCILLRSFKKLNYKILKIFNFKIENLQKNFKRKNLNYKKVGDSHCYDFMDHLFKIIKNIMFFIY